ncbi:ParB/RepB/Spo0J family partition protein [Streptomyces scabiei]|uniref:ParB/RepB/Spo0J family partition protein n=1 Tax=Streptomyces scabiei TaxID=1930 RepID=UPI0029A35E0B|nr:ParB/RepB/Spo0J family partition protein [Streptomyces scabiei]MDX3523693.1 ParB/RepB/Spo0J family partition protein [Streptomyces scabiei]
MTPPQQRVTRGFSMGEEGGTGEKKEPRRIRTRQQIMNGEGKRAPAKVPLELLAGNPFNPRDELTEIEETAESLLVKQIQPVTVVRRAAFLEAHPGTENELGETAEYVVIDGNRRLEAAKVAGLAELRIDVNDDLAATAADIVESALIANIHRVDVPPMDQAKAIQELVKVHGSQGEVARRLGKTPPWVSQRLALLELTPDLQKQVETGTLKVEPARRIGRLPKEKQADEAQKAVAAAKAPRQRRKLKVEEPSKTTSTVNAVNTPESTNLGTGGAPGVNGVNTPEGASATGSTAVVTVNAVNTPVAQDEGEQPRRLPYDDAFSVVRHLQLKMEPAVFVESARLMLGTLREQHPDAYKALLHELTQESQQPA